MQFIKVDIDGTGKKWRLAVLREQGTMFYFPEEDFEDLVENYDDCEKSPVAKPSTIVIDEIKLNQIINLYCSCGGCGPEDDPCVACAIYHKIMDRHDNGLSPDEFYVDGLVCDTCKRHIDAPYDIGDECVCGGHFISR